jgi:C-terminal processing protease CtpA/Prc
MANMTFSKCKEDAAQMGYLPIEEAGFLGIVLNEQQINGENVVARVKDGSPADKANIKPGDVIVAVKGQKPAGIDDLYNLVFGKKNDPIEISVKHEGQIRTLTLIRAPREFQTASSKD